METPRNPDEKTSGTAAETPADQTTAHRPTFGERLYRLRSVVALSVGSLILGGVGGAALGAVSSGSDSDSDPGPGGRFGGPPGGQQRQPGQLDQQNQQLPPGQPPGGTGTAPDTST